MAQLAASVVCNVHTGAVRSHCAVHSSPHQRAPRWLLLNPAEPRAFKTGFKTTRVLHPQAQLAPPQLDERPDLRSPHVLPKEKALGRLMRIQTLREDPVKAPQSKEGGVVEVPIGSWQEVDRDTWQGHLLYPRSFYDQFIAHVKQSSDAIFGEGMGPFADMMNDPSELSADLGPTARQLVEDVEAEGGLCQWLGFLCTFPRSKDSLRTIGDFLMPLFFLDDWLEQQGAKELEAATEWWRQLWVLSCSGKVSQASESIPACFASEPQIYKLASRLVVAHEAFNARAVELQPDGPRRVAWGWYLWASKVIDEVEASQVYEETQRLPTMLEYLRYRSYTAADMGVTLMAATECGVCLSNDRFQRAIPLLVYTALITGLFNDILPASKDSSDGMLGLVTIVGQQQAAHVHNVLVDCICEEFDHFLADAKPGDSSQEFVDLCRATIFGGFVWHITVPHRYRLYVENTRQSVAIADCAEGQLTNTRSPLYRELRELVASISRDVPSEIP